jgi:putative lumazine-binding protein
MKWIFAALVLLSSVTAASQAQSAADSAAIRITALDYVEGWYEGNPQRMARAVHPELVKRIVVSDTATKQSVIQSMGATALVNGTRHGYGKTTPKDRQQKDVAILDIFGNAATAKAVMADWVDYLQLARVNGRWVIVNVLWEKKPESKLK